MRVLFLDIDGVLNTHDSIHINGPDYIDPKLVDTLRIVILATKCKIILSSSWRNYNFSKKLVQIALSEKGLNFIDCTKKLPGPRAEEIKDYLNSNKISEYAILDDDPEAGLGLESNFFKTNPEIGLTTKIAQNIIEHFRDIK